MKGVRKNVTGRQMAEAGFNIVIARGSSKRRGRVPRESKNMLQQVGKDFEPIFRILGEGSSDTRGRNLLSVGARTR